MLDCAATGPRQHDAQPDAVPEAARGRCRRQGVLTSALSLRR